MLLPESEYTMVSPCCQQPVQLSDQSIPHVKDVNFCRKCGETVYIRNRLTDRWEDPNGNPATPLVLGRRDPTEPATLRPNLPSPNSPVPQLSARAMRDALKFPTPSNAPEGS